MWFSRNGRPILSALTAVATGSLLSACAAFPAMQDSPRTQEHSRTEQTGAASARSAEPVAKAKRVPPRQVRPPTQQAALPRDEAPPGYADQPPGVPEIRLVGASRDHTAFLLGSPIAEREAAPAKVWHYRDRAGECVVDIYFYLDVARNDFFALHYDVRNGAAEIGGEAADHCLRRIYSESRK
jgi:hypothetical protein